MLLTVERGAHGLIGQRQVAHGLVGRELCDGRLRRGVVVLVSEFMEPDQIKGIDQTPAARVCRVVAEQELVAVVDDSAARGGAAQIGITVGVIVHGFVDAGQERVHSTQHVIGAAEGTHKALLFFGVALLHSQLLIAGSAGNHRPARQVTPVNVCTQQEVHGQQ